MQPHVTVDHRKKRDAKKLYKHSEKLGEGKSINFSDQIDSIKSITKNRAERKVYDL